MDCCLATSSDGQHALSHSATPFHGSQGTGAARGNVLSTELAGTRETRHRNRRDQGMICPMERQGGRAVGFLRINAVFWLIRLEAAVGSCTFLAVSCRNGLQRKHGSHRRRVWTAWLGPSKRTLECGRHRSRRKQTGLPPSIASRNACRRSSFVHESFSNIYCLDGRL